MAEITTNNIGPGLAKKVVATSGLTVEGKKLILQGAGSGLIKSAAAFFTLKGSQEVSDVRSYLGTYVFSNLEIAAGSYETLDGEIVDYEGIRIDTILFNVTREKNIIETAIVGRDGSVSEYASNGAYQISASGLLVAEDNVFPYEELYLFNDVMEVPEPLDFSCEFLDELGIDKLRVKSHSLSQIEGYRNVVQFKFEAKAESDLKLILDDEA